MKIIFIRHGQTTGDVENRYGGDYDDSLSEEGIRQAEQLPLELKSKEIELIISSPLIRAKETSRILSSLGCPIIIENNFKERNQYGILSGMIRNEALEKYPELVEKLKDKNNTIDGAESYEDFSQRIQKAVNDLIHENKYANIAVVWHGGPMRVLFREILNLGELKEIGDCAWVEVNTENNHLATTEIKRIELASN